MEEYELKISATDGGEPHLTSSKNNRHLWTFPDVEEHELKISATDGGEPRLTSSTSNRNLQIKL